MIQIQRSFSDRLFGWWYAIAVPRDLPESVSLHEREYERRTKLTSVILLIELLDSMITMGIQANMQVIIPLSITILALIVGVLLNRFGKTRAAGILVLVTLEVGMCLGLLSLSLAPGGLVLSELPVALILVKPDLIAISLFPSTIALPVGLFNCVYTCAIIAFSPKSTELANYIAISPFSSYFFLLSIQIVVIVIGSFWVNGYSHAMERADRAEEVNKLAQALALQQQTALDEKQRLEESVQQIIAVHAQAANGNLNVRVPLNHNNILWSIAGSLNNLLARLQRSQQEVQQQQRMMQAIQQTLHTVQLAKGQGKPLHLQRTGTPLDLLLVEITEDAPFASSSPHNAATPWERRF